MKTSRFVLAFAVALASVSVASAGDKAKTDRPANPQPVEKAKASSQQPAASANGKDVTLTGSYLKRDVQRKGMITDGPNQVLVLDDRAIRNSGASDVRQLLSRYGAAR